MGIEEKPAVGWLCPVCEALSNNNRARQVKAKNWKLEVENPHLDDPDSGKPKSGNPYTDK